MSLDLPRCVPSQTDSERFRSSPKTLLAAWGMFYAVNAPVREDAMTWYDSPWVFLYSIVLIFVLVSWAYVPA